MNEDSAFAFQHGDRPAPNPRGSRSPVLAMNGMVATSQPLASAAALQILLDGGTAVDAAITAAAVLNVVEPMMTGIGGDMLALVCDKAAGKPAALNACGWSGSKATPEFFTSHGIGEMPAIGIHSVSVPGAVAGWFKLHQSYGRLPMARLLAPAIDYAEFGFPVSEIVAGQWRRNEDKLRQDSDAAGTYLVDGRAPRHGDVFRQPHLAHTLKLIARGGRDVFYKGEIARKIAEFSERNDGLLTEADLAEYDANWVEPVSTRYRGYDVFELGPSTQGIVALQMLNILEDFDLMSLGHNSAAYLHLLIEAKKLAFADRDAYLADPGKSEVPIERLISKTYAAGRRRMIRQDRAMRLPAPGLDQDSDTVYLTVVDKERNVVSFINSIFAPFGSGLVAGDTGICLQNRGGSFRLDPGRPNCLEPRKRPFHTLAPAMILKAGRPFFSFGVMGGDMQPQGHVQVLLNLVDFGMDPQQAGEAPRFRHSAEGVALESAIGSEVRGRLAELGHNTISAVDVFGGYQGILIESESGVLIGGSDLRKDGLAIGY